MLESRGLRELLIADVALARGVVEARDAALALQRYWEGQEGRPVSMREELIHIGRLDPHALDDVEREVEELIAAAGGDAMTALTRRGGVDRSIHAALSSSGTRLSQALTGLGMGIRAPLRRLAEDRYLDFKPAGQGGMGVVYWALDSELRRQVAFKMIRTDSARGGPPQTPLSVGRPKRDTPASLAFETLKARFLQEATVTGGLEHPGIVPVYELGQTPKGIPYYTMRFVRGRTTLATAIGDARDAPIEERLRLLEPFLKLCDTVRYAHSRRVIHRDLKPENVALGEFGEVVLLDWGLAKLEGKDDLTASQWQHRIQELRDAADLRTIGMAGTPGYMAPEAAQGRIEDVDHKSDVYSLGVILFEILTGRLPFKFRTPAELRDRLSTDTAPAATTIDPTVPEDLSDLCARCLARSRADRPETVDEVSGAIRQWQTASALWREIDKHLRDVRAALGAAEAATADQRLRQVDRAAALLQQIEAKHPGFDGAAPLQAQAQALRERGIQEREKASGRRLLARVAVGALVVLTLLGLSGAAVFREKERQAQDARDATERALHGEREARAVAADAARRAERERDEKAKALEEREIALANETVARERAAAAAEKAKAEEREKARALEALRAEQANLKQANLEARAAALAGEARAELRSNPMLGLLLARVAVDTHQAPQTIAVLHEALQASRQRARIEVDVGDSVLLVPSPDGRLLFLLLQGGEGGLRKIGTEETTRLVGHEGGITDAAFSGDGRYLATASADATARLWDMKGNCRAVFRGHGGDVMRVAASPDGSHFATMSTDDTVRIWDERGEEVATLDGRFTSRASGHFGGARADVPLAFAPDGRRLLTVDPDRGVEIWNLAGKRGSHFQASEWAYEVATFTEDGKSIVAAGQGCDVVRWQLPEGPGLSIAMQERVDSTPVFSADGTRVAFTTDADNLGIVDLLTGDVHLSPMPGLDHPHRAVLSEDGTRALAVRGRTAVLCDAHGRPRATLSGHERAILAAVFLGDGSTVATLGDDATLRLWREHEEEVSTYPVHVATGFMAYAGFSPDGLYAAPNVIEDP